MIYAKDAISSNPVLFILIILAFFGAIVGLVIFLKRKVNIFKSDDVVKSDQEIAEEELNRVLVDVEDEIKKEEDEEDIPHEDDTLARQLGEIDDPEAIKAMEEYARQHQEEEEGE